jgi:hypothetical protein
MAVPEIIIARSFPHHSTIPIEYSQIFRLCLFRQAQDVAIPSPHYS